MMGYMVEFDLDVCGYCKTLTQAKRLARNVRKMYLRGGYKSYSAIADKNIVIYKRVMSVGEIDKAAHEEKHARAKKVNAHDDPSDLMEVL